MVNKKNSLKVISFIFETRDKQQFVSVETLMTNRLACLLRYIILIKNSKLETIVIANHQVYETIDSRNPLDIGVHIIDLSRFNSTRIADSHSKTNTFAAAVKFNMA